MRKAVRTAATCRLNAWVEIVEQVVDMGVSLVTISGGEPFLRERIDGTISRLGRRFRNQGFMVYSNGTLIDEATAARLGELGNVFIAISLEGFEPETDARRGDGVFAKDLRARQLLVRHGVLTGFWQPSRARTRRPLLAMPSSTRASPKATCSVGSSSSSRSGARRDRTSW